VRIADYAADQSQRVHRALSAIVYLTLLLTIGFLWGPLAALRAAPVFGIMTAGIWFAEAFVMEKPDSRHFIMALPRTPALIRLVCWFGLLGVPAIVLLFSRIPAHGT